MSKSRNTTALCIAITAVTLALTLLLMNASALGIQAAERLMGYETTLFDSSRVHSIDIVMDDWEGFLENAESEEYVPCTVVIDGDKVANVALRAKGNTSLSNVSSYGNDRYSLKLEFDGYETGKTYRGLDKLALNNNIQDNTLMKDFLTYKLMAKLGVPAPLTSYAWVTVNGEDFGLYLALEAVEDSFLERNYGIDGGELYKPDSMSMGGGRGNGKGFDMEDFRDRMASATDVASGTGLAGGAPQMQGGQGGRPQFPDGQRPEMPEGGMPDMPEGGMPNMAEGEMPDMPQGGGRGGMGSDDVKLIYSDDDADSYENIFSSAKTNVTSADEARLIRSLKALSEGDAESCVDTDEVIRYFAVHNFVLNFDSYTGSMIHNYYLYEKDGLLSMLPWDYNLAFGGFGGGSDATEYANYPIDSPVSGGDASDRPMIAWIFENEEYTALYHQYLEELTEFFDSGEFETLIDQTQALISPYAERDENAFCTYDEFTAGVSALKEFCLLRAQSVSGQLSGAIPATSDGQATDSSALIDASAINMNDMGSMGGGRGGKGGMPNMQDGMGAPQDAANVGGADSSPDTGGADG